MESLRELYRIGKGPSSSHTMGPDYAATAFVARHQEAARFLVTLYGSLAATGKGHMTDWAIVNVLDKVAPVEIDWQPSVFLPFHPNGMTFRAYNAADELQEEWTVYSVGGGALSEGPNTESRKTNAVYNMSNLADIQAWCEANGRAFWEYVEEQDDQKFGTIWHKYGK